MERGVKIGGSRGPKWRLDPFCGAVDCGATPADLRRSTIPIQRAMEQKALKIFEFDRLGDGGVYHA